MNKISYSVVAKVLSPSMLGVYIRCKQFKKSLDIDTSVHVFRDEWDYDSERVVENPNAKDLNILIRKTLYTIEEIELSYNGSFTLSKLRSIWKDGIATHDFYAIMENQIENRDIRQGTQLIHKRVLTNLREYKKSCSISELNEDFVRGFLKFLHDKDYAQATVSTMIRVLSCYYHIVKRLFGEKVPADTFQFYHEPPEEKYVCHKYPLDDTDIRKLENYVSRQDIKKNVRMTLERFLFMSYTGLRISDFQILKSENFTIENGVMWLSYTSVKTNTKVRLPISCIFDGRAEQLYNRHSHNLQEFFTVDRNSFNICLKRACKKVGLEKHVSAHVARHTFATRLVSKDVPITTIQKVIGHKSLDSTMIYAKTNDFTLMRQLSV